MFDRNPFSSHIGMGFDDEESLDACIHGMHEARNIAWDFNPWKHVVNFSIFMAVAAVIAFFCAGCSQQNLGIYDWHITNKVDVNDWTITTSPPDFVPPGSIDATMQTYVDTFKAEGAARGVATDYSRLYAITWEPTLGDSAGDMWWGVCQVWQNPDGTRVSSIQLNDMLAQQPQMIQTLIITHEISHCLLGVDHVQRVEANVLDIMFWSSGQEQIDNIPNYEQPAIWSTYLDFLFEQQGQEVYP